MDSFTIAVLVGGAIVILIFGAMIVLDKGKPPVPAVAEPVKVARKRN